MQKMAQCVLHELNSFTFEFGIVLRRWYVREYRMQGHQ